MKKNIVLFTFFSVFSICAFGKKPNDYTQYYKLIREARTFFKQKDYSTSLEHYKKAISLVDYVHIQNLLFGVKVSLKLDSCRFAFDLYKLAISQGYSNLGLSDFTKCKLNIDKVEVDKVSAEYYKNFNSLLKIQIDSIYSIDQSIRVSKKLNGNKSDSLNMVFIKNIIESYGYVDERVVGEETSNNFFIILLHFDSDLENKYLEPIIKKALFEGKISPENYAWIVDRRLAWGPQRKDPYYFQLPTKKLKTMSKEEIEVIDNRRKLIGLKSIAEMNIKFNDDGSMEMTEEF